MLKILGVDKQLVGTPGFIFLNDIVDSDVNGVRRHRSFDLIGCSFKFLRPGGDGISCYRRFRFRFFVLFPDQDPGNVFRRAEGGAAFETGFIRGQIDIFEILKRVVRPHIDGFGDGAVNPALKCALYLDMFNRRNHVSGYEIVRQLTVVQFIGAEKFAVHAIGVIGYFHFRNIVFMAVADLAGVPEREYRFQAAGDIAGKQTDRAGRRDRGQMRVAQTVFADGLLQIPGQIFNKLAFRVFSGIVHREHAFFLSQFNAGFICGAGNGPHDFLRQSQRFVRTVADSQKDKQVSQAGDADAHAPFGDSLQPLLLERILAHVNDIIQKAHGGFGDISDTAEIHCRLSGERVEYKTGQVDRAEQAGAIRGQGLFAARIGGADIFTVIQIVHFVDAVYQDEARFREIIGGMHDFFPQLHRMHRLVHFAFEHQFPVLVIFHRIDEFVGNRD